MSADALLERLDRVRQTGLGRWTARCPAHEDKSPSLSIRETEGGKILLHDFGGCDVHSILAAIGLSFTDLFNDRHVGPHVKPAHSRVRRRDLVGLLDHEATVVGLVAADILANKIISADDYDRLATAVRRIGEARDHVNA